MSSINIGESFLAGLRAPHYANGRMLAAEDLKADQDAFLARAGFAGEAGGAGIVRGLEVTQVGNNLRVTAGLGMNRKGQVVRLVEESVELSLTRLPDVSGVVAGDGHFNDCNVAPADGGSLVESGAYLLAAAPVSQLQGSVSVKTISTNAATCASRWEIEGIQFKALRLPGAPVRDMNNVATYRNLLAHWCYGTQMLSSLPQEPFSFPARYTPLDQLSDADLAACDLPLAVFYWDSQVLSFVDSWSVRRRVTQPFPSESWHAMIADRREADGQARFLQFQTQIEEMRRDSLHYPDLGARHGEDDFRYLPPAGFLPIAPDAGVLRRLIRDAGIGLFGDRQELPAELVDRFVATMQGRISTARVFDLAAFFGAAIPWQIGLLDRDAVDSLLVRSWRDEALDFAALQPPVSAKEATAFDVYIVTDTLQLLLTALLWRQFHPTYTFERFSLEPLINALGGGVVVDFSNASVFDIGIATWRDNSGSADLNTAYTFDEIIRSYRRLDISEPAARDYFLDHAALPPQYAMFVKRQKDTRWIVHRQEGQ